MMVQPNYCAIYDFELLPYALGDVLTWNIQTALRSQAAGRPRVDAYLCVDPRYPSSIYQRSLVLKENCALFFNELFGAFGTHPTLGNIFVFTDRDEMLARLRDVSRDDPVNAAELRGYEEVLGKRDNADALNAYFIEYIYSHGRLNSHAAEHGAIPLLVPSRGCEPDIEGLISRRLADKRIVIVHPRLRRLDHGLGGDHTYSRDSDFLEWYEFLRLSALSHPDVQFVVVGRLQEKPLELLKLPNVLSLRTLGLGLGHELTLMLRADLFIGTSSGFAAMANFSATPYFITKMNKESCNAYAIPNGSAKLPFAKPNQELIYETETAELLRSLLERGLAIAPSRTDCVAPVRSPSINVDAFEQERAQWLHPAATTGRLFVDEDQADQETAFLIWPKVQEAAAALKKGDRGETAAMVRRTLDNFPRLQGKFPELALLAAGQPLPATSRPLFERLRRYAAGLNADLLPPRLRGTFLHHAARRLKKAAMRNGTP